MSKPVKKMEMDTLTKTFKDVRDLIFLSVSGVDSITDNQMRLGLRKKGIRMQVVKNTLARRVFSDLGMTIKQGWDGPTTVAWGGSSVADLTKELEVHLKKLDKKVKVKTAVADGEEITFEQAKKRPTRDQALGRIVTLALSPASRLASQILGPASQVAGQIMSLKDKKEEAAPAAAPAEATAPAPA